MSPNKTLLSKEVWSSRGRGNPKTWTLEGESVPFIVERYARGVQSVIMLGPKILYIFLSAYCGFSGPTTDGPFTGTVAGDGS